MLCLAFFVCLVVVARRRRSGERLLVPAIVMGLGVARGVLFGVAVALAVAASPEVGPEERGRSLAEGLDSATASALVGVVFEVPLLVGAWVLDRRLRTRRP